jgi:hypothetical protein
MQPAISPEYHSLSGKAQPGTATKRPRNPGCGKRIIYHRHTAEDTPMPEEIFKSVAGDIAGEAGSDLGQDVADLVGKLARQELERRYPGPAEKRAPLPGTITSDELDAQVPESTVPFEGIKE